MAQSKESFEACGGHGTRGSSGWKYITAGNLIAVAVFAVFAAWILMAPDAVRHATREDGPVEYATALMWGLSAVGFLAVCVRSAFLKRRTEKWKLFFTICFALVMIFFCSEEISWGQHLLGIDTPVSMEEVNRQNEITIHNMGPLQFLQDRLLLLFIAAVAVVFPALAAFTRGRALIQKLAFPVLPAAYIGFFILGYVYIKAFHGYDMGSDQSGEVRELLVSFGMFLFGLHGAIRPDDLFRIRANQ